METDPRPSACRRSRSAPFAGNFQWFPRVSSRDAARTCRVQYRWSRAGGDLAGLGLSLSRFVPSDRAIALATFRIRSFGGLSGTAGIGEQSRHVRRSHGSACPVQALTWTHCSDSAVGAGTDSTRA